MTYLEEHLQPYSRAAVALLKGTVERDSPHWNALLDYQLELQNYLRQIGLEVIVKKDEGFAYLRQMEDGEGNTINLVSRRQVGFEVSIVLIVLRQLLENFDSNPDPAQYQSDDRFVTATEIREELELYLPETPNHAKLMQRLDQRIKKVVDLGYLVETPAPKENGATGFTAF